MPDKKDEKIKETTEMVVFVTGLASAVEKATLDGFQWTDVLQLLPPMTKLPAAIEGFEQIPSELEVMDDGNRLELSEEIAKLGFEDKSAEVIGEQALRCAIEFGRLIVLIREEKEDGTTDSKVDYYEPDEEY